MITYKAEIELNVVNRDRVDELATWTRRTKIKEAEGRKIEPARRFFRIGTAPVRTFTKTLFRYVLLNKETTLCILVINSYKIIIFKIIIL